MGKTSNTSNASTAQQIAQEIKNIGLNILDNDNYINNTLKNAFITAANIAITMQSIMDSAQKANLEEKIENVMFQGDISIIGSKDVNVNLSQYSSANQCIVANAYLIAVNQQSTDASVISIASDMLDATQSIEQFKQTVQDIASAASADSDLMADIENSQSASSGSFAGSATNVSNSEEEQSAQTDIYNNSTNINVSDTVLSQIQEYLVKMTNNVKNSNDYFLNAEQNLNAISTITNIMIQKGINIADSLNINVNLSQISEQTQEIYTELISYYNNIMFDKLYHYYENKISQESDQSIKTSDVQSQSTDLSSKTSASESAEESTEQTAKSTSLVQDIGEALSSIAGSITGPIAIVIIIIVAALAMVGVSLAIGLTKIVNSVVDKSMGSVSTVLGNITNVSGNPNVKRASGSK